MTTTVMAAALERAGINVATSQLRMIATDAMRKHHMNVERAIPTFERMIDGDKSLIREALRFYLSRFEMPETGHSVNDAQKVIASDRLPNGESGLRPCVSQSGTAAPSPTLADEPRRQTNDDHLPLAGLVREPSAAQVAADIAARTKTALTAFDRELTHTGRMWGNVYYRDLDSMTEDGDIAREVRLHIGHRRGDDRHKMIRELMTPREFAILLNKIRGDHAA